MRFVTYFRDKRFRLYSLVVFTHFSLYFYYLILFTSGLQSSICNYYNMQFIWLNVHWTVALKCLLLQFIQISQINLQRLPLMLLFNKLLILFHKLPLITSSNQTIFWLPVHSLQRFYIYMGNIITDTNENSIWLLA